MDQYLDKLRSNGSEWHIPFYDTIYPAGVDAYWSRLRDAHATLQKADAFIGQPSEVAEVSGNEDSTAVDDPMDTLKRYRTELRRVIEEEPYKPTKLLEATSRVMLAVHAADNQTTGQREDVPAREQRARER